MKPIRPSLVAVEATDHLILPGLLFEPNKKTKKVAVLLHGTGGSSILRHQATTHLFAETLTRAGISYLALNNRGAGYLSKVDTNGSDSVRGGMAYELISECTRDIDGVIKFLQELGYDEISLIGFSTGANKICHYHYKNPRNPIAKYVLCSGADDVGLYRTTWGEERFDRMLSEAKKAIDHGKGRELIVELAGEQMVMSWQSLYDTINPNGDYNIFPFYDALNGLKHGKKEPFVEFSSISTPSLAIYGAQDEYGFDSIKQCVDILKTKAQPCIEFKIIDGADHGFSGKEQELVTEIVTFLKK